MPDFTAGAMGTPNRGTSEQQLDQWNQAMRQSPIYLNFMRQNGLPTDGHVKLSRGHQGALESALLAGGFKIPSGMHIDQGGNLNQKNRLVRNVAIGAGLAAGGLGAAGAFGVGPAAGLFSGASGAGGLGAAATGLDAAGTASSAGGLGAVAGGSPWAVTPYATTATMSAPGAIGAGGALAGGAGAGVAGGIGSAASEAGRSLLGLSARDWAALAASGVGTIGGLMSNQPLQAPTSATTDPNMQKLLATMQGRLDQSEPLYKSIMAMANGLLPTQYQNGGSGR